MLITTSFVKVLRQPLGPAQYTSEQFQRLMADHGVVCSISRAGNVWENAAILVRRFESIDISARWGSRFRTPPNLAIRSVARKLVVAPVRCLTSHRGPPGRPQGAISALSGIPLAKPYRYLCRSPRRRQATENIFFGSTIIAAMRLDLHGKMPMRSTKANLFGRNGVGCGYSFRDAAAPDHVSSVRRALEPFAGL